MVVAWRLMLLLLLVSCFGVVEEEVLRYKSPVKHNKL